MNHTYKFHLGEVVWYHLPRTANRAVKARITSVSRVGQIGAERYSIERLDEAGHAQIHGVKLGELSHPQTQPKRTYPNGECHHAAL